MAYEFRALKAALRFYDLVCELRLPRRKLKDQLVRAAESVALQLAEGDRRASQQDRLCFFNRAFTSVKEAQMALVMGRVKDPVILDLADYLGASVYKLMRWQP
jgi:four helix bundle protein